MSASNSLLDQEFKEQAEHIATSMRVALSLPKHAPLCAFKLAKHLGIPVKSIYECGIANDGEKYDDWSAALIYRQSGRPIIIHNVNHSLSRQQSSIMHEISHYYREHPLPQQSLDCLVPTSMMITDPLHEAEALYLGGALQLPKIALSWAIHGQQMMIPEIARKFVASPRMVQYRVNMTGFSEEVKRLKIGRQQV